VEEKEAKKEDKIGTVFCNESLRPAKGGDNSMLIGLTYNLYAVAHNQFVPHHILLSGPQMPIDVFPTAKPITAICSMN
jgi:hypothetical protein